MHFMTDRYVDIGLSLPVATHDTLAAMEVHVQKKLATVMSLKTEPQLIRRLA